MNSQRDEEMLSRGLKALVAEMESLEAPAAVETKVLEAFRARRVVVPMPRRRVSSRYWWAAVAAMLLIAISLMMFRLSTRPAGNPHEAVRQTEPQQKPQVNDAPPSQRLVKHVEDENNDGPPQRPYHRRVRPSSLRRPETAQVANHLSNEIATDFIPLSYMSAASLQDGGQIVRVQLPRAALANFGLPVNMDRYNEKVKADVLVGVDGLAHAIRFVQ
jgi:hypothetical protein